MTMTLKSLLAGAALACLSSTAAAVCVDLQGQQQQGGLVWGQAAPGVAVTLDGRPLDVLADGTFIAGFGRDAARSAELVVGDCRQPLTVASREYDIQRVEGVPQQTVTPPPEVLARIARERELVNAAKARYLARPDLLADALAGFRWPVEGRISGVYGSQRVYNGTPGNPHYGVDVAVPTGTIVRAPTSGVVTLAEPDLFYSGGTIILDHGYRLSSSFLHLSRVRVAVGDEVQAGDIIGEVGATGRATGPHLDWRMAWRNERIDPQFRVPPRAPAAAAAG
ncbi:MAG: M23 family metallopeptidase, partial [Haliea sp.]|uniref:M23 family metallopeptidase n=1 Tax=Haliea sp. TaxID=1932666 RepID=UPI0032F0810F